MDPRDDGPPAGAAAEPAEPVEAFEAVVRGRVQGVGFRFFVLRQATSLGLSGWVANEPDGSVRLVAEGPPEALRRLVQDLRVGPAGGRVDEVNVEPRPPLGRPGFGVRSFGHGGD